MKLKDKLVKEYVDITGDSTDGSSFLAGFEKARELALCELGKFTDPRIFIARDIIEELGEDEVLE